MAAVTKHHRPGGLTTHTYCSKSGGWTSKVRAAAWWVPVRGLSLVCRRPPSDCGLMWAFLRACVWTWRSLVALPLLKRTRVLGGLGTGHLNTGVPTSHAAWTQSQQPGQELTADSLLSPDNYSLMTSYLSLNSIQSTTISQMIRRKTDFYHVRDGREMRSSCGVVILQTYADNPTLK